MSQAANSGRLRSRWKPQKQMTCVDRLSWSSQPSFLHSDAGVDRAAEYYGFRPRGADAVQTICLRSGAGRRTKIGV